MSPNPMYGNRHFFRGMAAALVASVLLLSLVSNVAGASSRTTSKPQATSKPKIAVLVPLASDTFWAACVTGAQKAGTALGLGTLKSFNANDSTPSQAEQILTALAEGAQAIIVAPNDSVALDPQLRAALDDGVYVYEDNTTTAAVKSDGTIQMNEVATSRLLGERMLQLAHKEGLKQFTVVELVGILGTDVVAQRTEGFAEAMASPPAGMHVTVIKKLTNWVTTQAVSDLEDVLSTTKINGIFTQSDLFSPSLIPVLERYGYGPIGSKNHAILAGLGGIPGGIVAVRDGWENFTMNYPIDAQCGTLVYAADEQIAHKVPFSTSWRSDAAKAGIGSTYAPTFNQASSGPNVSLSALPVTKANVNSPALWANHVPS